MKEMPEANAVRRPEIRDQDRPCIMTYYGRVQIPADMVNRIAGVLMASWLEDQWRAQSYVIVEEE